MIKAILPSKCLQQGKFVVIQKLKAKKNCAKITNLIIQESKKDYGKGAVVDTKEISQADDKFDGGDQ